MEYNVDCQTDAVIVAVRGRVDESSWAEFGMGLSEAIQAARSVHPNRQPFVLRVGHQATIELGVAVS